jgi:hypothetical protein
MWGDEIEKLYRYAIKRYYPPVVNWDKRRFELRCYEILAYENAIRFCMDNPLKDPRDILEGYQLYLEGCVLYFKKKYLRRQEYVKMRGVVINLISKLKE